MRYRRLLLGLSVVLLSATACTRENADVSVVPPFQPLEVIDLGALITEDLPERVWGKAQLAAFGLDRPNSFEVVEWSFGEVEGSNAFYTLANHGGPHLDAPNHMGLGPGLDAYPIESFSGPLKVVDVRDLPPGRTVPREAFTEASIDAGDIVAIYTGYTPPTTDEELPVTIALSRDAAEYLAEIPVRAFATDAWSVANLQDQTPVESDNAVAQVVPIHHSFLSRGIPIYEQLFNLDKTLDKGRMYFVGVPLNIRDGDGMVVRPVVLVY